MEQTKKQSPKILSFLGGLICAYLITAAALLILAFLLYKLHLDEMKITVGIIIIYILSCLAGGFYVGKKNRSQKFMWGLALGGTYFFVLAAISAMTTAGITSDFRQLFSSLLMCAGAGMLGGMIS